MAGFSLSGGGGGGGGGGGNQNNQEIPPEHLFLLRNQEISSYNKSLELWQQQQQEQYHHHHHHQEIYPTTMGMGVGPSSSMRHQGGGSGGGGGSSSGGGGGGISCQDCGNQAKKDCSYMRCRTCCKSRGFDCSTHVKSTWVPASRRRERQQQIQQHLHEQPPAGQQDLRSEHPKRLREHKNTTTSTVAPLHPPSTSAPAGLQVANFPAEVSSPAMFRCVRVVSAMDEGEDQYAYQTAVSIGGHLFKGILYDQGPNNPNGGGGGGGEGGRITGSTSNTNVISTSAIMDPSSMYPPPLNAFLAGKNGFQH